jgi:hypothetical protein
MKVFFVFKSIIFSCLLGPCFLGQTTLAATSSDVKAVTKNIVLGVIDKSTKVDFESKLLPFLNSELSACKKDDCTVKNFSPYNDKGEYSPAGLLEQIQQISGDVKVVLFNFNEKSSVESKVLVDAVEKLVAKGVLVVAAAGLPVKDDASAPLAQTVFGQVSKIIIIGELGARYELPPSGFFGPEMLTAIRPPKEHMGQGLGASLFATQLVKNYNKRTNWHEHLQQKKSTCRKIWLEMNDCFSR